jgi:serine O-acetyltransferase
MTELLKQMLKLFRIYCFLSRWKVPLVPRVLYLVNRILFSVVLPPTVRLGKNVTYADQLLAVVIHARATIGSTVYVGPQVIVGGRSGMQGVPVIGNDVFIGAGARLLGPIKIGDGATIGAAALVLTDVAAGETVAGVPARPIANARRESPAARG